MHSKERTSSGPKRMTAVMSWILGLQGRCTIKSMAKFQASMFAGVTPDLVCHGFPLQPAQYPLESELESELDSSISSLLHTVCMHLGCC